MVAGTTAPMRDAGRASDDAEARRAGHRKALLARPGAAAACGCRSWAGRCGGLLALVVAISAGSYIYLDDTLEAAAPNTPEAKAARRATRAVLPGEPVNVLLIGSDTRPQLGDPGRSDTLILVRMDNKRGFISMLSFPRDLLVNILDVGQGKINSAYCTARRPRSRRSRR